MWKGLVERRVSKVFADISTRQIDDVVLGLAPDVHHRFAGTSAIGGERTSRTGVARWFARLFRLYRELTFDVHRVSVSGVPWRCDVTVEWTARAVPVIGEPYLNRGVHVMQIVRGKVTHLHAYEDSAAVEHALRVMAEAGITEAGEPPISG